MPSKVTSTTCAGGLPGPGLEGGRHLTDHAGSIHLRHKVYKYFLDQDWREDDTSQTMLAPSTTDTRYISTSWTKTGGRMTPHGPCWLHPVMLLLNRYVTFVFYFIYENIILIMYIKAIFQLTFSPPLRNIDLSFNH